jgi:hypothetical protein
MIEDDIFEKACENCEFQTHYPATMTDPDYYDCEAHGDPTDRNCPKHNEVCDILEMIEAL